ncbi:MAG: hypothetical protein IPJ04_06640 [Candidatus Eisenbacteria bacterium]|nr:hypothetical protein [Candidatus Eisenbacteria bacterium]
MLSSITTDSPGMRDTMSAPSIGWRRIIAHSSLLNDPGLRSTSPGTLILPRSCSSPATPRSASVCRGSPSCWPMPIDSTATFTQCVYVYSSWSLSAVRPTIEYSCFMMLSTIGCTRRFAWRRSGRPVCRARSTIFFVPSTARQNTFFARDRSVCCFGWSARSCVTSSTSRSAAGTTTMFVIAASASVSPRCSATAGSSAAWKIWKKRSISASSTPGRKRSPPT